MNVQFRVAIGDSYETDTYIVQIETKLCETYDEAMDEVIKQLKILQDEKLDRWYVELIIYKYRWKDLKKFGREYNDIIEEIRYYPKDFNREA